MHDPKTIQLYRDAQELFRQERWAEALRIFDDLSLTYKSDKDIMLNRAMCLARIGKEEEAELLCDHITVVHQDPRGAQLKAQIPSARREGQTAPEEKKERKPLVSAEMVKAGIITCFVLAVLVAGWTFYSTYEPPLPPAMITQPAPGERVLRFPSDLSLGDVLIRDWGYESDPLGEHSEYWKRLGPAQGDVEVPAGKEVRLQVAASQVAHLGALRRLGADALQSLYMKACPIADSDLAHIAHLTGLLDIDIDETPIGPEGFAHLRRLTSLRRISLNGTNTGEAGKQFIGQQYFLRHLDADRAGLRDEWLIGLPPLEKLDFLSLDDTEGITDAGIKALAQHRNLEHLFLSYTGITDEGMKAIQSLKALKRLWFEGTAITDASMDGFRLMPNIEEIGLAYTAVTTNGLMKLADISTLKKVGAKGCENISAEGIRRFKARNPDCIVETNLNVGG